MGQRCWELGASVSFVGDCVVCQLEQGYIGCSWEGLEKAKRARAWCEPSVAWEVAMLSLGWSHVHTGVGPVHRSHGEQAMADWDVAGLAWLHGHALCMMHRDVHGRRKAMQAVVLGPCVVLLAAGL